MHFETRELPPIGTNAFILSVPENKECVVVDAPMETYSWATRWATDNDCRIRALLLTHGHWDHIIDAHRFAADDIPVYGHPDDRALFDQPACMASYAIPGLELKPAGVTRWFDPAEPLEFLGQAVEVRHVPGHCPGNVLLYFPKDDAAIVGDVIFARGVGRYDLPGGDLTVLERSIREQVYTLPDGTTLYPGHGPTTTVGTEKVANPFVRP